MRRLIFLFFSVLILLGSSSFADKKSPVLTNDDLIKFKKDSDNHPVQRQYRSQPYVSQDDKANEAAYDSWCDAGSQYRNRVDRAKKEVEEAEEKFRIEKHEYEIYKLYKGKLGRPSSYLAAEKNLEYAKKRLANAELDLSELESQAHRKRIKPGWLRCQK